jgi:hypothetical protein
MNLLRRKLCLLLAAAALPARAHEALPAAVDLRQDAQHGAVLVLFSLPGCRYCEAVRREHLSPLLREARPGREVRVREVDMSSAAPLTDFAGVRVTHMQFARANGVRLAPTVMGFAAGGRAAGRPIVGAKIPEFYGYYLANLVDEARGAQGLR